VGFALGAWNERAGSGVGEAQPTAHSLPPCSVGYYAKEPRPPPGLFLVGLTLSPTYISNFNDLSSRAGRCFSLLQQQKLRYFNGLAF
jgi:hypothetical protein